jgi:tetratricopeptide (TPR) repeat protein
MKKYPFVFPVLILLLISFLLILNSSCKFRKNTLENASELADLRAKATSILQQKPDSALIYADSGIKLLKANGNSDTSFIPFLFIEADAWLNKGQSDSAMNILLKARSVAIGASDSLLLADSSIKLGEILVDREDYNSAEKYIWEAMASYEKNKKDYKAAKAYNTYSTLLIGKGDNMKAQEYLMKAIAIYQRLESYNILGGTYITIGYNNNAMGNKAGAAKYYQLAISQLAQVQDTTNLRIAYSNMGVMFRKTSPDSALSCYRKAIALLAASDSSQPPIIEKYNIANLYLDQKQYAKALEEYDVVLELCQRHKLAGGIARVYSGYASVSEETGKLTVAASYLIKAVHIADSIGDISLASKLRQDLMMNYREQGKHAAAMLMNDTIKMTHDTITARDNKTALRNIEQLHEAENKELENRILKNELKNQADRTIYRWIIIVILAGALLLMFYLYRKISRLYVERTNAYHTLISKYKHESELLSRLRSIKAPEILPGTEPQPAKDNILEQLIEYYVAEKPYLDPKLKVANVAEKLNCSRKEIATALKGYTDSNFNAFTNRFRVDMAIAMMDNPTYSNYKTEAIAKDAGFGSKSNFYDKFESCTGVKLNYYRNYHSNPAPDDSNAA